MANQQTIALIGLGTIGLSFASVHLTRNPDAKLRLYDVRDDLEEHILSLLPVYLESCKPDGAEASTLSPKELLSSGRITVCSSIEEVCQGANIIQESGPDSPDFKRKNWVEVVKHASSDSHLWSSTSGIAASTQSQDIDDKSRVLVVHPFNPTHIMPLIEIVPSPETTPERIEFAKQYWANLGSGHRPVVINKETTGFVGNRLAFALLREACHLVNAGVVSAEDVDTIVETSLGPRWAAAGPFKTYNFAGGAGGIGAFLHHLGPTIQACWDDAGTLSVNEENHDWVSEITAQTEKAYGKPTPEALANRDHDLKNIIHAQPRRTA